VELIRFPGHRTEKELDNVVLSKRSEQGETLEDDNLTTRTRRAGLRTR
jgi:hypothetical protein